MDTPASTWRPVSDTETQYVGQSYRMRQDIRLAYNALVVDAWETAWRINAAAKGDITIDRFEVIPPAIGVWAPNTVPPWTLITYYHVNPKPELSQAGFDPRGIIVLAGLVVAGLAITALASQRLEKLVTTAGEQTKSVVHELLNPGVLVLVVVAIFLITRPH